MAMQLLRVLHGPLLVRVALVCLVLNMSHADEPNHGLCEHEGTCGDVLGDDFADQFAKPNGAPPPAPPPPPPPPPPHGQREGARKSRAVDPCIKVTDPMRARGWHSAMMRKGSDGFSQATWKDDKRGKCWCFGAETWKNFKVWGKTRVVEIDQYNVERMHLWVGSDETILRNSMSGESDSWLLAFFMRNVPGMQSHSCSPFGHPDTCVVRTSPFESVCVGVKAKPANDNTTLTVRDDYEKATLVPLVVSALLFVIAPSAAHSVRVCTRARASACVYVCV